MASILPPVGRKNIHIRVRDGVPRSFFFFVCTSAPLSPLHAYHTYVCSYYIDMYLLLKLRRIPGTQWWWWWCDFSMLGALQHMSYLCSLTEPKRTERKKGAVLSPPPPQHAGKRRGRPSCTLCMYIYRLLYVVYARPVGRSPSLLLAGERGLSKHKIRKNVRFQYSYELSCASIYSAFVHLRTREGEGHPSIRPSVHHRAFVELEP